MFLTRLPGGFALFGLALAAAAPTYAQELPETDPHLQEVRTLVGCSDATVPGNCISAPRESMQAIARCFASHPAATRLQACALASLRPTRDYLNSAARQFYRYIPPAARSSCPSWNSVNTALARFTCLVRETAAPEHATETIQEKRNLLSYRLRESTLYFNLCRKLAPAASVDATCGARPWFSEEPFDANALAAISQPITEVTISGTPPPPGAGGGGGSSGGGGGGGSGGAGGSATGEHRAMPDNPLNPWVARGIGDPCDNSTASLCSNRSDTRLEASLGLAYGCLNRRACNTLSVLAGMMYGTSALATAQAQALPIRLLLEERHQKLRTEMMKRLMMQIGTVLAPEMHHCPSDLAGVEELWTNRADQCAGIEGAEAARAAFQAMRQTNAAICQQQGGGTAASRAARDRISREHATKLAIQRCVLAYVRAHPHGDTGTGTAEVAAGRQRVADFEQTFRNGTCGPYLEEVARRVSSMAMPYALNDPFPSAEDAEGRTLRERLEERAEDLAACGETEVDPRLLGMDLEDVVAVARGGRTPPRVFARSEAYRDFFRVFQRTCGYGDDRSRLASITDTVREDVASLFGRWTPDPAAGPFGLDELETLVGEHVPEHAGIPSDLRDAYNVAREQLTTCNRELRTDGDAERTISALETACGAFSVASAPLLASGVGTAPVAAVDAACAVPSVASAVIASRTKGRLRSYRRALGNRVSCDTASSLFREEERLNGQISTSLLQAAASLGLSVTDIVSRAKTVAQADQLLSQEIATARAARAPPPQAATGAPVTGGTTAPTATPTVPNVTPALQAGAVPTPNASALVGTDEFLARPQAVVEGRVVVPRIRAPLSPRTHAFPPNPTVPRPTLPASAPQEIRALVDANRYQEAVWYARENGLASLAADLEGYLARHLEQATVKNKKPLGGGITQTYLVTLEDGTRGVFKPRVQSGPGASVNNTPHEVAASRLDHLLGLDLVPTTVTRTINGQEGSLQLFIENAPTSAAIHKQTGEVLMRDSRLNLFDYLVDNRDRHHGNFIAMQDQGGRLVGIDHGLAFSAEFNQASRMRAQMFGRSWIPDRATYDRLKAITREQLERELGGLVAPDRISLVLQRRDHLVQTIDQQIAAGTVPGFDAPLPPPPPPPPGMGGGTAPVPGGTMPLQGPGTVPLGGGTAPLGGGTAPLGGGTAPLPGGGGTAPLGGPNGTQPLQ